MIGYTSRPSAWTQSSRSTPTSLMHNISFTSRLQKSCSVEILSGEAPEEYDSWKLSGSHGFREGIGSTHRGILGTYIINFKNNNTSSAVEHAWESGGYNLPKALCIRGKGYKVTEYEGRCRIKSEKRGLVVHKGSDVSISTQPEEERMQGDQIIETTD